ncbi:MAG: hypothetical protein HQK49_03795 [Oligoflexia bacterium]|nr:hypothetical protein [Oligoflexia bacterium]
MINKFAKITLALVATIGIANAQTLVEGVKSIHSTLKESPLNFKLTITSDTARSGDVNKNYVSSMSTLYTPYLSYNINNNHTVGVFSEVKHRRDYSRPHENFYTTDLVDISLRYDNTIFKNASWSITSSNRLLARTTDESKSMNGDNGYIDLRFYADKIISDTFKIKNELRLFVFDEEVEHVQNSTRDKSYQYYLTPSLALNKDFTFDLQFYNESMSYKKAATLSYDYIQVAPTLTYQINKDWNTYGKVARKIFNSHDGEVIAPANATAEFGFNYIPSRDFDFYIFVSSPIIDQEKKLNRSYVNNNYYVEVNVNIVAF